MQSFKLEAILILSSVIESPFWKTKANENRLNEPRIIDSQKKCLCTLIILSWSLASFDTWANIHTSLWLRSITLLLFWLCRTHALPQVSRKMTAFSILYKSGKKNVPPIYRTVDIAANDCLSHSYRHNIYCYRKMLSLEPIHGHAIS